MVNSSASEKVWLTRSNPASVYFSSDDSSEGCKFLAVVIMLDKAFLDNPKENKVPCLATSNKLSTKTDEHRSEIRVASEKRVIVFAK
jgi:hypothetical protein